MATVVWASVVHRRRRHGHDDIAVERAVRYGGVPLGASELCEAIRVLTGRRLSARLIALHLGTTDRTVCRHRPCADGAHKID